MITLCGRPKFPGVSADYDSLIYVSMDEQSCAGILVSCPLTCCAAFGPAALSFARWLRLRKCQCEGPNIAWMPACRTVISSGSLLCDRAPTYILRTSIVPCAAPSRFTYALSQEFEIFLISARRRFDHHTASVNVETGHSEQCFCREGIFVLNYLLS